MTLEELYSLPDRALLVWLGMEGRRDARMPCPVCGEGRRGGRPVARLHGRRWTCNACHASEGRADLLARVHYGKPWGELTDEQRALAFGQAPPPRDVKPPPVVRLGDLDWEGLRAQLGREPTERARAWLASRGLEALPGWLYVGAEVRHAGLRFRVDGAWQDAAALGYEVFVPLLDGVRVRGGVVRAVGEARPKARSLCGYDAAGLVMMDWESVRLARAQREDPRPVVCVEGVPDFLTACFLWPHYAIRGVQSGSEARGEAPWFAALRGRACLVLPHPDPEGARHAAIWRRGLGARVLPMDRLAALAGVEASGKDDLNDLHLKTPDLHRLRIHL